MRKPHLRFDLQFEPQGFGLLWCSPRDGQRVLTHRAPMPAIKPTAMIASTVLLTKFRFDDGRNVACLMDCSLSRCLSPVRRAGRGAERIDIQARYFADAASSTARY